MKKFVALALALAAITLTATDAKAFGRKGRCGGSSQSCQPAQGHVVTGCQGNTVVASQPVVVTQPATATVSYTQYAPATSAPVPTYTPVQTLTNVIRSGCDGSGNCSSRTIFRR